VDRFAGKKYWSAASDSSESVKSQTKRPLADDLTKDQKKDNQDRKQ